MGLNDLRLFRRWTVASYQAILPKNMELPLPFLSGSWNFHNWIFTDFAFVKDTRLFVQAESTSNKTEELDNIFIQTSFKTKH
jgi:hypothetical protein